MISGTAREAAKMGMYGAMVVTCWLCLAIVAPRKPRWGNEAEELVSTRLLGRQQVLMVCATIVTAFAVLAFVATVPQRMAQARLSAEAPCVASNQQATACGQPVNVIMAGDAQRQLGARLKQTGGGFTMALDPATGQPVFYGGVRAKL